MKFIFFAAFVLYGIAVILEFTGTAFKKDKLLKSAWFVFLAAFAVHTVFLVVRGVAAKRLPLSNQFEFANAFAWGVALMLIVLRGRLRTDWLSVAAMPAALLVMTYAALQPMEIRDLMPALRSAWFGVHIGSAVLSYSAFVIAGSISLRYLLAVKKQSADERALRQMDYLSYRLVAFGFLFLTVVILSGAIWAEQAWSAFWTWAPKEVWALITWIIYAVYLHLRLRMKRRGTAMAWFLVIAVPVVFFTFAGVNTFMHGLHTYG
ncbi:MAG: c-type cytochrome biogenesis protein CcsB [Oscillospiraceae bacterium]|nr:c-type cytochrome biogenesis protein CcsB [Oscillospiraceae bacterium]